MRPPRNAVARPWVSVFVLALFLGLAVTGVLNYATPYDALTAGLHTLFGLAFLLAASLHVFNNLRPLTAHLARRAPPAVAGATALATVAGLALGLPPFRSVVDTGYELRQTAGVRDGSFAVIETRLRAVDGGRGAVPLRVTLRAGPHYESPPQPLFLGLTYTSIPQVAIWLETPDGRFLRTLYVTKALATGRFTDADDPFGESTIRRPEALPVWSHRRGVAYEDGLFVPARGSSELDAITAPTPSGHYDVATHVGGLPERFRVLLEINRSYDFNAYWHRDRFPDDPVYSGSGSSGQPSLVYAADVERNKGASVALLRPVGHGHPSGRDGSLTESLEGFDTALGLLRYALVEVSATSTEPSAAVASR